MEVLFVMFVVAIIGAAVWSAQLKKSDPEKWQKLKEQSDERNKQMLKTGLKVGGEALLRILKK